MNELSFMKSDMEDIHSQIKLISKKVIRLYEDIDKKVYECDSIDVIFNFKDFKQVLNSILFLEFSCSMPVESVGMDFILYWNFEKNIFVELNVLLNKLFELIEAVYSIKTKNLHDLKNNAYSNEKIKNNAKLRNRIIKISDNHYLQETKEIRNKIEHGIDPFFTGEFIKIKNSFKIDKVFDIVKTLYEIFVIIHNDDKYREITDKKYKLRKIETYKIETKVFLKDILENLNDTNIDLRGYIEIYGKYVNEIKNSTSITEREKELSCLVYDMTFKYMTLSKTLAFSIGTMKLDNINLKKNSELEQFYYNEKNIYEYFTKASLSAMYSLYEKIGMFLINAFKLDITNTYFKSVIKYVCDNKIIDDDNFIKSLILLRESKEYEFLNITRQAYIHGVEEFKYEKYIEHISNLLIKNIKEVQQVVKYINEYFINVIYKTMNIELSNEDIRNIERKIRLRKIEISNF